MTARHQRPPGAWQVRETFAPISAFLDTLLTGEVPCTDDGAPVMVVWSGDLYEACPALHWAPLALIAAAAELLAAAIRVNALSIQTDAHKELRAAIAKATGDDDAAPECTCAAKDMTFGRCCKVTPNANVTGLAPEKGD